MKICRPDLSVILIDSIHKKIAAVQAMIDALTVINNEFKGISTGANGRKISQNGTASGMHLTPELPVRLRRLRRLSDGRRS